MQNIMCSTSPRKYLSFLLRLWQSSGHEETVWHASLEDIATCERQGFASLAHLYAYLETQTGTSHSPLPPVPKKLDQFDSPTEREKKT